MKLSMLSLSLVAAVALCTGCADWNTNSTRSMGAGPVNGTLCRDGTVLPLNSSCKIHGGVAERGVNR